MNFKTLSWGKRKLLGPSIKPNLHPFSALEPESVLPKNEFKCHNCI